jgi:toxin ParE1/3/4
VSAPPRAVLLTAAAEADLEEIRAYTEEHWGQAQWVAYFRDILSAFERIAAFPHSGRHRDAFVAGLRSVPCREHVIFYLPDVDGAVVVQRVLHAAQNSEALRWADRTGG